MKVKPMLGDWEIPRIAAMETLEQRDFVELPVPGRAGSLFQDLNTAPTCVAISGSLFGDEDRDTFLETLRGKYRDGEPVTFTADIVTATDVQYVVIETLFFEENAANPDETFFYILLRESPPPPPPSALPGLDADLLDVAGDFLDSLSAALDIIDSLGGIPDIGDPTAQLSSALDGVTAATSGLADALTPLTNIFGDGQ